MSEGRVGDLYQALKQKAVDFSIRPGDRLNEGALARELGVSRTPLREALNRLVAEQLLEFHPGTGFFCRALDAKSTFDLYELREFIEVAAIRTACSRASDDALLALKSAHYGVDETTAGVTLREATTRDEQFHIEIAQLTGNLVLVRQLQAINERIRFIRWVDMAARVKTTKGEHRGIIDALIARDENLASQRMSGHITRRMDQVIDAVKEGIGHIYMGEAESVSRRMISGE